MVNSLHNVVLYRVKHKALQRYNNYAKMYIHCLETYTYLPSKIRSYLEILASSSCFVFHVLFSTSFLRLLL